jgi:hypothetical protein
MIPKPVYVMSALVFLAGSSRSWPRGATNRPSRRHVSGGGRGSSRAPVSYRVDAAVYREVDGVDQKLEPGARLSLGDKLSLHLHMSVPAHVYVVNEDEMGDSYLCSRSRTART